MGSGGSRDELGRIIPCDSILNVLKAAGFTSENNKKNAHVTKAKNDELVKGPGVTVPRAR